MTSRPRRSLGQNFLIDPAMRARIVEETRVNPGQTVVEIGPGRGALTEGLARRVGEAEGRLVLIELDDELSAELARRFRDSARVDVIHRDVLEVPLTEISDTPEELSVVGNIPYNLTSPILFHLLSRPRPGEILVMVQREVADRILSEPGSRAYGALTVGVRAVARVERVLGVAPGAFRPRPRVASTVLRIVPLRPERLSLEDERKLRRLTRAAFQWRRKQLAKTLRDHPELELTRDLIGGMLAAADARPEDRPETVAPEGLVAMARLLPD